MNISRGIVVSYYATLYIILYYCAVLRATSRAAVPVRGRGAARVFPPGECAGRTVRPGGAAVRGGGGGGGRRDGCLAQLCAVLPHQGQEERSEHRLLLPGPVLQAGGEEGRGVDGRLCGQVTNIQK